MSGSLYSRRSNLIIGFHGTTKDRAEEYLSGSLSFHPSTNDYDWLGSGMYFWENNYERAKQWAEESARRKGEGAEPAVIGAILDLGYCLDLTDSEYLAELKEGYKAFKKSLSPGDAIPKNSRGRSKTDFLIRKLDCAVINYFRLLQKDSDMPEFDSVRGVFWEGRKLYNGAGFKAKNHIQIAIVNPNCIKGYFRPRDIDEKYPSV